MIKINGFEVTHTGSHVDCILKGRGSATKEVQNYLKTEEYDNWVVMQGSDYIHLLGTCPEYQEVLKITEAVYNLVVPLYIYLFKPSNRIVAAHDAMGLIGNDAEVLCLGRAGKEIHKGVILEGLPIVPATEAMQKDVSEVLEGLRSPKPELGKAGKTLLEDCFEYNYIKDRNYKRNAEVFEELSNALVKLDYRLYPSYESIWFVHSEYEHVATEYIKSHKHGSAGLRGKVPEWSIIEVKRP